MFGSSRAHSHWRALILCLLGATQAPAQETEVAATQRNALPTIEVTGTRLKRTDALTSSPVDVITREDIERSGKRTLSDVVRGLSADNNGSISLGNISGFAQGASGVALRGLAVNATLVLINGRRMTSYGLADDGQRTFVNLSAIPLDVVDRVEVLKDGASAIYGSDAIAGVVNIILRDRFQGLSTQLGYAVTEYGDGSMPRISVTGGRGGLDSDGYNVFVNVEASRQDPIYARDRKDRRWIGNGDLRPYGYSLAAGGTGPNIGGWFDNSSGFALPNRYGAVSDASLATPVWTQLPGCQSRIHLPAGLGGCPYDRVQDTGAILPSEGKLNLYLRGSVRVSTAFNPYFEFGRFQSDTKSPWVFGFTSANESWVDPANDSVVSNANLRLPAAHPDNPLGVNTNLSYLLAEAGARTFEDDSVAYRALIGGNGELGGWECDAGLLYAHDTTERIVTGFVRNSVLEAGLNGTGPYGYYRLGVNAAMNSAAFRAALSPTLSADNTSSLTLVDFKASREWLSLPAGPLGLSVGAEYRRETLNAPPMPYTNVGDIIGWSYYVYGGQQTVYSAFAEGVAPLLRTLSLDAAFRVERVVGTGGVVTPKVGFRWKPWRQVTFRGTYSEGYRAPTPAEEGPNNQFSGTLDLTGNGFLGVFRNTNNPNLKPEKSNMITLGSVLEPWPSMSLAANFWWLERKDEINGQDPFAILAGASGWPNAVVVKDAMGDVLLVSSPFENNSRSRLRGIDFSAGERVPLGRVGTLSAKLSWAYLASYQKTFTGGTSYEYAGTHGPEAVSGDTGTPKNKANLSVTWDRGAAALSAYVNFVDSFLNMDHVGAPCDSHLVDGSAAPPGCRIASFTTVDLRGSYRPTNKAALYISVINLFDRIAPLDPSGYINLNFDPSMHLDGAIGRTFSVGLKYDF
ncbi:MAG TPA: TonB-dependent receptor [Steroidobacteraceae bacterium]|nr:TonB-dependent receptor [Steroidobacteraceae bacterium]